MSHRIMVVMPALFLVFSLISCGNQLNPGGDGPEDWFSEGTISRADLAGATALGVLQVPASRAVEEDEEPPSTRLYKLLAEGSWVPVDFSDEDGQGVDFPVDLLHLVRLSGTWLVLVFGERYESTSPWSEPGESWTDTFILDADTGGMYYLNEIATAGDYYSIHDPARVFAVDDHDHVYYLANRNRWDNFTEEYEQVRNTSNVVKLTVDEISGDLTGEFITSDTTWVHTMAVDGPGNLVYDLTTDDAMPGFDGIAFRTAAGTLGFVSDHIDTTDWTERFFTGKDGEIYVTRRLPGDPLDVLLNRVGFAEEAPVVLETTVLYTRPGSSTGGDPKVMVRPDDILVVDSSHICQYQYTGVLTAVEIPVEISVGRVFAKAQRYVYVLNSSSSGDVFAVVADLVEGTASEFPFDSQRYQLAEFRDYAADPTAMFARLTDILTGTTSSYALYPDGTTEEVGEEVEETLVITIEPM